MGCLGCFSRKRVSGWRSLGSPPRLLLQSCSLGDPRPGSYEGRMGRQCREDALRRLAGRGTHDRPHDGEVIQNNPHKSYHKDLAQHTHETPAPRVFWSSTPSTQRRRTEIERKGSQKIECISFSSSARHFSSCSRPACHPHFCKGSQELLGGRKGSRV